MDNAEKLRITITKILFKNALKLFGAIIYKFDIGLMPEGDGLDKYGTAYCTINPTTKKPMIRFNEDFIAGKTIPELIYVVLHEIIHFIDGHLSKARSENKHPEIFNMACDHVINTMLDKDAEDSLRDIIASPKERFKVKELNDKEYTVMEVYEWLMDNYQFIDIIDNGDGTADVKINGKSAGKISYDLKPGEGEGSGSDSDQISNELKTELRSIINNVIEKSNGRGNVSGSVYEYIKKVTELVIPWEMLLENAIETTLTRSSNRSWKNLHKRYRVHGIMVPANDTETTLDDLYIMQDVSGSVGTKDQEKFMSFILQSTAYFHQIVIYQHDTEIKSRLVINRQNFELNKHKIFELCGRGGTSHNDCFTRVEDEYFEDGAKVGLIVILSDFESDIESIWGRYEFHKEIPVKALCTSSYKIPPYVDPKPIYIK